ncbi:MAG: apolipoprotein N-acyltransferase, partial [Alphaproteobacteria bacterium]
MADRVRGLRGWRRWICAFILGAAAAVALPPIHLVIVLPISFTGLVWLIEGGTRRQALAVGWWFGFGYFVVGLYWIANALMTDPERFAWMIPFATAGLPALLAVFPALAAWLVRLAGRTGVGGVLVLAGAWGAGEWLRGVVLTGFPWNLVAHVWDFSAAMLQPAALVGAYGLSILTVAVAAMPAALAPCAGSGIRPWRGRAALLAALAVLGVWWGGGAARLAMAPESTVPGVRLRLVQANVAQTHKWRAELREAQFARHLRWTRAPAAEPVTHVIWPETAVPYVLALDPLRRRRMAMATPPGGLIISGAVRTTAPDAAEFKAWNSLQAIDTAGRIRASYDKAHLVPFGEYVPLRVLLEMTKITHGRSDFSAGPGARTLDLPGLPPASPLICYEAIFPGRVTAADGPRPAWLLNVTNDAWYGLSAGPYQHFAAARLRGVEEGLPLVRAANTGISAVVDGYGRITARLGLGEEGVLDAALPAARAT